MNKNAKREHSLFTSIKNLMKDEYIEFSKKPKGSSSSSQIRDELDEKKDENEDFLQKVLEYESIFQPQEEFLKTKGKVNKSLHLLEVFRDKIHKTNLTERATCTFLMNLLLDLEEEFSSYLRSRKCRWIGNTGCDG